MYYVLDGSHEPHRRMDDWPYIKDVSWWQGKTITQQLPKPLNFLLETFIEASPDHSSHIPAFFNTNPPLFRDDLIEALRNFGVTNFDTYDSALTDPDSGKVYNNYKTVNFIGFVSAADLERSDAIVHDNTPSIDVDSDKLVIDEKKTFGLLMFRMAESSSTVLIHEKLKDYLIEKGYTSKDLKFWDPTEIAI